MQKIYSLYRNVYEMVTGLPPFSDEDTPDNITNSRTGVRALSMHQPSTILSMFFAHMLGCSTKPFNA